MNLPLPQRLKRKNINLIVDAFEEALGHAKYYDTMIPWEQRLQRELPLLTKYLQGDKLLDLACSTGRHSFALESKGYHLTGLDISEGMIALAREHAVDKQSKFYVQDIASPTFHQDLLQQGVDLPFDGGILLGNAIANMQALQPALRLLENAFTVIKPGGRLIVQTIHRPKKANYLPLRTAEGRIVQRIQIPVTDEHYNVELHVNQLSENTYASQQISPLYMFTNAEFATAAENIGWQILHVFSNYSEKPNIDQDGTTAIWVLERPFVLNAATKKILQHYSEEELPQIVLQTWAQAMKIITYRSVQNLSFLYPRVSDNPFLPDVQGKNVLDVGCGIGSDLQYFKLKGAKNITGVDSDTELTALGTTLFGFSAKTIIINDICESLPEEKFDIIHTGSLLHFLTRECSSKLLTNIQSKLLPTGVLFGRTTQGKGSTPNLPNLYTKQTLQTTLHTSGFATVEIEESTDGIHKISDAKKLGTLYFRATID